MVKERGLGFSAVPVTQTCGRKWMDGLKITWWMCKIYLHACVFYSAQKHGRKSKLLQSATNSSVTGL